MRTRSLVALIVASVCLLLPAGAQGAIVADKERADKDRSGEAKADDKPEETRSEPAKELEKAPPGTALAFATYRVFATQFEPTVAGSVEVAVPDKCVKFAALRNTTVLGALRCSSSYTLARDYRIVVARDNGESGIVPVKEAGPWNIDDNWWSGRRPDEPRRMATDLPAGRPQAEVASRGAYNMVDDCKDLEGKPTGKAGGADQFGRCVLNPAGIDLSVAAARALGMGPVVNEWVNVTLLWEPVEVVVTNVKSGKSLDVKDASRVDAAPVIQHSYLAGAHQHWRLRPLNGDVYTATVGHTNKLLDVKDRSLADGASLIQHAAAGGTNQQWRLVQQSFTPAGAGRAASGVFTLVSMGSGKVLDVAGGGTSEALPIVQTTAAGTASQSWRLTIIEPPVPKPPPPPPASEASPAPAASPSTTAAPATGQGGGGGIASPRELPAG